MKRLWIVLLVLMFSFPLCAGGKKEVPVSTLKVGMITDGGRIDDASFNQGLWEGVLHAQRDFGLEVRYVVPSSLDDVGYAQAIDDLAGAGYGMILCVGSGFSRALSFAEDIYPSIFFAQFDGQPDHLSANCTSVSWKEQDAAFLAAVGSCVTLKSGTFAFLGGVEMDAVKRYEDGWKQGIAYANERYGTAVSVGESVYLGTFNDEKLAQSTADKMYENGASVIFTAAGNAGKGAIMACRNRRISGVTDWIVGVDVDQFDIGFLPDRQSSVVLTSAVKRLSYTSYSFVQSVLYKKFPGGQHIFMGLENDGVGVPERNPNLSPEAEKAMKKTRKAMT
jgi:basic membrane protein A